MAFLSNFDYFWEQSYLYLQRPHLSILCGLGTIQTLSKVKCTQFTRGKCLCKGNYRSSSEIFKLHSRICVHQKKSFFFTIWRRRCFDQIVTDRILSFARAHFDFGKSLNFEQKCLYSHLLWHFKRQTTKIQTSGWILFTRNWLIRQKFLFLDDNLP